MQQQRSLMKAIQPDRPYIEDLDGKVAHPWDMHLSAGIFLMQLVEDPSSTSSAGAGAFKGKQCGD